MLEESDLLRQDRQFDNMLLPTVKVEQFWISKSGCVVGFTENITKTKLKKQVNYYSA